MILNFVPEFPLTDLTSFFLYHLANKKDKSVKKSEFNQEDFYGYE
jgi:hypothetical protein